MYSREMVKETAARLMREETGIVIPATKFANICRQRFISNERDDIAFCLVAELKEEERRAIKLNPREYDTACGIRAFDRLLLISEQVHPAILEMYNKIFSF